MALHLHIFALDFFFGGIINVLHSLFEKAKAVVVCLFYSCLVKLTGAPATERLHNQLLRDQRQSLLLLVEFLQLTLRGRLLSVEHLHLLLLQFLTWLLLRRCCLDDGRTGIKLSTRRITDRIADIRDTTGFLLVDLRHS